MRIDRELPAKMLELSLKKGAALAEVFMKKSKNLSIEVKSGAIEAVESSLDFGYAVRVIREGRLGFSYSTNTEEAEKTVEAAVEASRWTGKDEFLEMPGPAIAHRKLEIYDPAVEQINETDLMQRALEVERGALEADPKIKKTRKASASVSVGQTVIMNSKGNAHAYKSTSCTAQVMAVAEGYGDAQTAWEFEGSRFLGDVSFRSVGSSAAQRALRMLGAKKMSPKRELVLLDRAVGAEFLGIFGSLLSSEAAQKGKSLLKGRVGQKVISGCMDIIDNGLMAGKLGSRPVDDEGFPTSEKTLIKEGVLRGFLYNVYTAKKEGKTSTGNAVRYGISGVPGIGPLNLYPEAEDKLSFDDILKKMDDGLYILEAMGVHTANAVSGEFSIGVSGLWVEAGRIRYPVKEAVISGNILDFMGKAQAIGDDIRFYGSIGSPSLLIGPVDISG